MVGLSSWSLTSYQKLCLAAKENGYSFLSISDVAKREDILGKSIIMRHDIDRFPGNALKMAALESQLGIRSTYYVRMVYGVYRPELIDRLQELGHEVGYHYEVVSKAKGDLTLAGELFRDELIELRKYAKVSTAAAHGSPLSKFDNQSFWLAYKPEDYDLICEAYQAFDHLTWRYITDTGRCWDADNTNLRDRLPGVTQASLDVSISTIDDIIELLSGGLNVCLQSHPERWAFNTLTLLRSFLWDQAANSAKRLIRMVR